MFLDLVRNAATFFIFFSYCIAVAIPVLIVIYLPFSWGWVKIVYGWIMQLTAKVLLLATFLPVTYQGMQDLPQGPAIYVANHQSSLDIILVASLLDSRPCCWLAWHRFFNYPLLGQILHHSGIPVYPRTPEYASRRGAVKKAVKRLTGEWESETIYEGARRLSEGMSVILFPEGGRYMDRTIHPFYSGCAAMGKLSGAPVVPLFISGTGIAMGPGAHLIKRYPLMITVGKPMICGPDETVAAFKERIEQWFIELTWRRNYLLDHYGLRICNGTDLVAAGQFLDMSQETSFLS